MWQHKEVRSQSLVHPSSLLSSILSEAGFVLIHRVSWRREGLLFKCILFWFLLVNKTKYFNVSLKMEHRININLRIKLKIRKMRRESTITYSLCYGSYGRADAEQERHKEVVHNKACVSHNSLHIHTHQVKYLKKNTSNTCDLRWQLG